MDLSSTTKIINIHPDALQRHRRTHTYPIAPKKPTQYNFSKIGCSKEHVKRIEAATWGVNDELLTSVCQLDIITKMLNNKTEQAENDCIIRRHIREKISSYKYQDTIKNIYIPSLFVNTDDILKILVEGSLCCYFCHTKVVVLYENVRECTQWTLDRVNNDAGHNRDNVILACLKCNLSRRRTGKDAFFINKNLTITKLC